MLEKCDNIFCCFLKLEDNENHEDNEGYEDYEDNLIE